MIDKRKSFLISVSVSFAFVATLCCAKSAAAQIMDYGALEATFGEPVTTSATGSPLRASDAPVDMIIVTADEIRRSGAQDIPGVLRHVAGIDISQWTNGVADVGVRGYNQPYSPRLLVLIDGRQVYADFYGFTPWSTLPVELSAIRQIEIVKGPSAALFGFNAVGGVINIVTNDPLDDDANTLTVAAGTQNTVQGSTVVTLHRDERWALRAMAGGQLDDEFSTQIPPGETIVARRKNYRGEVGLNGTLRLSNGARITLEANHSVAAQNEFYPGYTLDNAVYLTNSVKAELSAYTQFGIVDFTAYNNWLTERITAPAFPTGRVANQVGVVRLSDVFMLGTSNTVRLAGEYRHNEANTVPFSGGTVSYDVYSLSAMWAWTISPALSLTNAVRLDNLTLARRGPVPFGYPFANGDWNRGITEPAFNSGLVWKLDATDTLRLLAGRGTQLPSLVNLGAVLIETPPVSITGTPYAEPTAVNNYELSWTHSLMALDSMLQAAVFHQNTNGVLSNVGATLFGPTGAWLAPDEIGNSQADGLELNLKGASESGWRWGMDYRFEQIDDKFVPAAQNGADLVDFAHSTPRHLINANLGWSGDHWEIDLFARYQSATTGVILTPASVAAQRSIPDYVSLDGRIAYEFADNVTLALSAQNFGAAQQQQTAGPDVERRVLLSVSTKL